ncbi:carbon storage regulator [Caldalkalibacillus thermarum]|uniref:carbon storage regulator CsrA n=1 Tax=Caldalkalibacillus thermarum TaxID=296745 RepID=UPI00166894E6|nr:carbon storage regulator CsrA [Caldalkalibacillus thermarum]GGK23944.1 carbon storage regulator [Caldalkalibacillus thermarum]
MLVLARKKGESIIIDDQIEVKVVAVEGDVVKLGIEAPKSVSIHRQEVYQAIQEENRAARMTAFDPEWLKKLKSNIE